MADDVAITPGSGETIAADDVGGIKYQRVKVAYGADGSATDGSLTTPIPVRFGSPTTANLSSAQINAASSGQNTLLSGTALQTIRVFKFFMVNSTSTDVNVKFRDGAATDLHPAILLRANGGSFTLDFDGEPWFVTTAGNDFTINLSAAVQVSGRFYYSKS